MGHGVDEYVGNDSKRVCYTLHATHRSVHKAQNVYTRTTLSFFVLHVCDHDRISLLLFPVPIAISLLGHNVNSRWEVSHQCSFDWRSSDGLLTNSPDDVASAVNLEKPLLSPSWTSQFSFSKCHAHKKTPEDPAIRRVERGASDIAKFAR